jgi:hypothetical protein
MTVEASHSANGRRRILKQFQNRTPKQNRTQGAHNFRTRDQNTPQEGGTDKAWRYP